MILQCSHIHKAYGTDIILSDISFHINEHDKAAIVGINGSGKSTLLKIIMGQVSAEEGEVILRKDAVIGYLAQNQEYDSHQTILQEMQNARPEIPELERQINELSERMNEAEGSELDALIQKCDAVRHRFENLGGYAYQSELTGILKGLGFAEEEFDKAIQTLSGGEKTRVALAKMLLQAPDLIILDEPTNHLDISAVTWLENYLASYTKAVLIVAHDRYFLDKIVNKVFELRQTHGRMYQGNYTEYSWKRQEILSSMMKQYENQQAEIKHQEAVIRKLKSFNREKSVKRAESREKMLAKIDRLERPTEENTEMKLYFTPAVESGKDVLAVEGIAKKFGSLSLFSDIHFEIKRGEHVAIIGDNGSGKTTILKIIHELLPPDAGSITLGTNVQIAYYDQEHQILHPEKTLFEEIQDAYPDMTNTKIRGTLAAFLFTEDDVFKQIRSLSGGERGRISLAKLMLSDANLLLLDEPTNHLDMDSREILENAIRHFEGTVLYVSHDRYFINTTATRILHLTNKQLLDYRGNYDYYLEKREDMERACLQSNMDTQTDPASRAFSPDAQKQQQTAADPTTAVDSAEGASNGQLSWQQQKEAQAQRRKLENQLKKAEAEIEELENRNAELDAILSDPANGTNAVLLQECSEEQEANESKLTELMERWETLSEEYDGKYHC